jgi:hypothetical protein
MLLLCHSRRVLCRIGKVVARSAIAAAPMIFTECDARRLSRADEFLNVRLDEVSEHMW